MTAAVKHSRLSISKKPLAAAHRQRQGLPLPEVAALRIHEVHFHEHVDHMHIAGEMKA